MGVMAMKTNYMNNQALNPLSTLPVWGPLFEKISPRSNTGEKCQQDALSQLQKAYKDYPLQETVTVITDDGPKPVMIRRPAHGEVAVIDWLNLTMHTDTFMNSVASKHAEKPDEYCVYALENVIKDIFGFGIEKKMVKGINYYEETYQLENDCGFICIGGQNNTIMLSISGMGCTHGKYGWEEDLHAWLSLYAHRPKITRIDYAFDDLHGVLVSPDWADQQDTLGGFTCGGRPPAFRTDGCWKRPDGNGRTAYVGKRTSSKFCRVYEKGKQLGDPNSLWTRVEVEFKSRSYYIPLDALLNASEHFLASYPCFHIFDDQEKAIKFELLEKKAEIVWDKAIEITRHQFGKYLNAFRKFYGDDSKVLDILMPAKDEFPKRLKPLTVDFVQSLPPTALPA
jgi:phage replication initiation protein